ncbi:hypothetical protein A2X44_03720 [candidate division CPR3 bacterium GWF2_35_18]|uniref:Uncharacterized protein n=1 Tax=candidate division CPR3 bacterium GW2011_GWF2_35_18 TaxID=1618350 RepID=A0A0G0C0K0_UNCC3|nr:MAG: hypothetical protein UR67_C0004G0033 [candidate division CPR3 bacterium GW2011_GWF2_35_18]OGB63120.1 MAG: hypothetical protein A2X44_03720 [candidate division CPR3 bacterium GWF2_35_18]OGB64066.1 MAG: hypothetical protein A2250_04670 [candidate division CPR3 bacterium RIFOXYA2_FULL_35_13]OGB75633.1 MAG: hypothetical protein A2476_01805 [candidate division CPR3 bacterium RIFOXYC2_FULL_35_7]OGB79370.1 MAG: hypothetical protein A2296_04885 [candidate division CPR3 bacterium RIFOXYB2_FULL_3
MISIYIDRKIKDKFGLFLNPANQIQDHKKYIEIYGLVHDEIIRFVEDHINDKEFLSLSQRIIEIEEKEASSLDRFSQAYPLIIKSLMNIPDYEYRLYKRLDYFISNLYFDKLKNRNNKPQKLRRGNESN